jgi:anti-sigma regulatory factor (Ser/Thr protein kinase)
MGNTDTCAGARGRGLEKRGRDGLRLRLGRGPEAAAEARGAIANLRADLDAPLVETLRLLVTELVTNSVRHTEGDCVTLRVAIGKSAVLTEVTDHGPSFDPGCVDRAGTDDCGWGLFLVQRLSRSWGVKEDGDTKRVWFELPRA